MTAIPLFVTNDALRDLRSQVARGATADAERDIWGMLTLAWGLVEREPLATGDLLDQLINHPRLLETGEGQDGLAPARARIRLLRLMRDWLAGQTEVPWQLSRELLDDPDCRDPALRFDVHAMRAALAQDLGRGVLGVHEWQKALEQLPAGEDGARRRYGQVQLWLAQVDVEPGVVREHALDFLQQESRGRLVHTQAGAHHALGLMHLLSGDPVAAGEHFLLAVTAADVAGQSRQALISMMSLSSASRQTGEWGLALEAVEDALAHARLLDWPLWVGRCLIHMATCLRHLDRPAEAWRAIAEADRLLRPLQAPVVQTRLRLELGHALLGRSQPGEALRHAEQVLGMSTAGTQGIDRHDALGLQTRALAMLGELPQAHQRLHQTLDLHPLPPEPAVDLWQQLAQLEFAEGLDPTASLQRCLEASQAEGADPDGRDVVPSAVHEQLAGSLQEQGRMDTALQHLRAALQAQRRETERTALRARQGHELRLSMENARQESRRQAAMSELGVRRAQELQLFNNKLMLLSDVGHELTAHRALGDLFRVLDRHLVNLVPAKTGLLFAYGDSDRTLHLLWAMGATSMRVGDSLTMDEARGLLATCLIERRWVSSDELGIELPLSVAEPDDIASALAAPLESKGRVLGLLCVFSDEDVAFGGHDYMTLSMLVSYLAVAMDNSMVYEQLSSTVRSLEETKQQLEISHASLEIASQTDSLTGLWNRRFLQTRITGELDLLLRRLRQWEQSPPAERGEFESWTVFVLIDLDHFKRVNDTYGHAAGDLVLQQLARRLLALSRTSDHVVRWGGEEFLVVARIRKPQDAPALAERIRASVSREPFDIGPAGPLPMTCSIGHALYPFRWPAAVDGAAALGLDDWERAVELADLALYHSKRTGRNRATACLAGATPVGGVLAGGPEDWLAQGWVTLQEAEGPAPAALPDPAASAAAG